MRRENFKKLTPFGIAGNEGNIDVSVLLLKFFNKNREILEEVFKDYYVKKENKDEESQESPRFHIRVFTH